MKHLSPTCSALRSALTTRHPTQLLGHVFTNYHSHHGSPERRDACGLPWTPTCRWHAGCSGRVCPVRKRGNQNAGEASRRDNLQQHRRVPPGSASSRPSSEGRALGRQSRALPALSGSRSGPESAQGAERASAANRRVQGLRPRLRLVVYSNGSAWGAGRRCPRQAGTSRRRRRRAGRASEWRAGEGAARKWADEWGVGGPHRWGARDREGPCAGGGCGGAVCAGGGGLCAGEEGDRAGGQRARVCK